MGRSVTPKAGNGVTPVTVGAKTIQTPKYMPPLGMAGSYGHEMPSTNQDADVISNKSIRSQS